MGTTIGVKSTITFLKRAMPQPENTRFRYNHHYRLCICVNDEQTQASRARKICISRGNLLFYGCYDGVLVKEMFATESIFRQSEQIEGQKEPNTDYPMGMVEQINQELQYSSRSSSIESAVPRVSMNRF